MDATQPLQIQNSQNEPTIYFKTWQPRGVPNTPKDVVELRGDEAEEETRFPPATLVANSRPL